MLQTYDEAKLSAQSYANDTNQTTIVFQTWNKRWLWTTKAVMENQMTWFLDMCNPKVKPEKVEPDQGPWWIVLVCGEDYYTIMYAIKKVQAFSREEAYAKAVAGTHGDVYTAFGPFADEPNEC